MKNIYQHRHEYRASRRSSVVFMAVSFLITGVMISNAVQAIPAFARKYQAECSSCHSAWPALNATGRKFKENGYRLTRDEKPGFMNWDQTLPVAAMIKARPYQNSDKGERKTRALNEVELMAAGAMANDLSGWFELEAEDDTGFNAEVKSAALGYHPSAAANLRFSWGALLGSDPYDVYSDSRRLSSNRASVYGQPFGGADAGGRLRDSRQNISLYGRPIERLFYSVIYSGVAGDNEGEGSSALSGRLAVDVSPNTMIGLTVIHGRCMETNTNCSVEMDFTRNGIDAQADIGNIRLMGALLRASDDNGTPVADDNTAAYIEARYTFMDQGSPSFVPLLRLDSYEKNNGRDNYDEVTAQLAYYLAENARGSIEYWRVNGPTSATDDSTVTLQVEVGF